MTDLASTWATIAGDAMLLDPAAIRATIRSTHDRLPGGSRSSETGIRATRMERCTDPTCEHGGWWNDETRSWDHDHPVPNDPTGDAAMRPSQSDRDLTLVDHHEARYIQAVYELATRSHSGPFPKDWRSARIGHRRLVDMDAITVLEQQAGQKVRRWVEMGGDAIHDLTLIRDRHVSREAKDWEQSWTSGLADEQCCRLCLDHVNLRVERKAKGLCQMHLRLFNEAGEQDPPQWLTEEYRRIGSPAGPDWKKARSRWLQSVGVLDRSA